MIRLAWSRSTTHGSPMFRTCEKIRTMRMALVEWSTQVYGKPMEVLQAKLALLEALKRDNADGSLGPRVGEVEGEVDMLLLSNEQH